MQPEPHDAPPQSPAPTGPYPYGWPQPVMVVQGPPTSGLAVGSLVVGILGAVGGWCMFAVPCVVAVMLGHYALSDIKRTRKNGRGMAIAGLILGYVFGVPWAVLGIMTVVGAVSSPYTQ